MNDKFIHYEYEGKNLKVPVEQQKEFESKVPSAKMMLTYNNKNYKVPLSELSTFSEKVGADNLTYSVFDENKEYAPNLSTQKYGFTESIDTETEKPSTKSKLENFAVSANDSLMRAQLGGAKTYSDKKMEEVTAPAPTVNVEKANAVIASHAKNKSRVDEYISKIDEEYKSKSAESKKWWEKLNESLTRAEFGAYADLAEIRQQDMKKGQNYMDAKIAQNIISKTEDKVNQYSDPAKTFVGGAAQGFIDTVSDIDTWDSTVGAEQAVRVYAITKKLDKGATLTDGERMIVDALVDDLASDIYLASGFGRGYKAGTVTGESLPFMLETMLNPASGLGKSITKKFGKKILEKVGKKLGTTMAKAALAGTRVATDIAGAAIMSATTSQARVAEDALNRLSGQVDFTIGEDGLLKFNGFREGEDSAFKAYAKAFGANTIEHFSEMVGEYFSPIGKEVGKWSKNTAIKLADKVGLKKISNLLENMTPNGFGSALGEFMEGTQWHGTIGEFAEEMVSGALNALIVGDQTMKKYDKNGNINQNYLFDKDNLIDTFLGVALLGGVMSTAKTLSYTTPETQYNRAIASARKGLNGVLSDEEINQLEAFANNPLGVDSANLRPLFENRSEEFKKAVGKYLDAVMKKQGYEIARNANLSGTQQGMEEMRNAWNLGQNMTEADLYDINEAEENARQALIGTGMFDVPEGADSSFLPEHVLDFGSYDLFRLSERQDWAFTTAQREAIKNLAIIRNAKEGLNNRLETYTNIAIQSHDAISNEAAENGIITVGVYNDRIVYIRGGVNISNGQIVAPSNVSGATPVEIVDSVTGEVSTVNANEINDVVRGDVVGYNEFTAEQITSSYQKRWEEWRNKKSAKSKLAEIEQFVGQKVFINTGNGMTEVEVQQILPNGEVLIKGKKGDLGGQSSLRVDVDSFYDSMSRDAEGNPIFDQSQFRSQSNAIAEARDRMYVQGERARDARKPQQETTETHETEETVSAEPHDFRDAEHTILINGVRVNVDVTNQDNASDTVTYTYTNENGETKVGRMTIAEFAKAKEDAANITSEIAEEQVTAEPEEVGDFPAIPEGGVPVVPDVSSTTVAAPEIKPEDINWDALFEQNPEAYFAEMQKQFGAKTVKRLNAVIASLQNRIEALNKAKPKTDNEIFKNEDEKERLQERIDILNDMVARLTAAEEVTTEEAASETPTEVTEETEVTETEQPVSEEPATAEEATTEEIKEEYSDDFIDKNAPETVLPNGYIEKDGKIINPTPIVMPNAPADSSRIFIAEKDGKFGYDTYVKFDNVTSYGNKSGVIQLNASHVWFDTKEEAIKAALHYFEYLRNNRGSYKGKPHGTTGIDAYMQYVRDNYLSESATEEAKPVAPNPVENPIKTAKVREGKLFELLERRGVDDDFKADRAKTAGKEVADMFATREAYEEYQATARNLGEFTDDFNAGVEESFANRKQYHISNELGSRKNDAELGEMTTDWMRTAGVDVRFINGDIASQNNALRTKSGVVYGYVENGVVYLNPALMNPNTAIHEYTHLWDNALMQLNKPLWERGKKLMKQTSVWNEVINDPDYADIKDNEDLVASEVHSRLVGTKGAERLNQLEQEARAEGLAKGAKKLSVLGRLREWINEATKWLKDSFTHWTTEEAEAITLSDFLNMPLRDLANFTQVPKVGEIKNANGEIVANANGNGHIQFSIKTWKEGGRDYLVDWLSQDDTLEEDEKADIIARMDEFYENAEKYTDVYVPFGNWSDAAVKFDSDGNPLMSVIKANGDYAMNLDFSLVCKKRRPLNRLLRTLINRNAFSTYSLKEREIAEINWILQEHGFEVACALCFVDSKRYRVTNVADVFAALYNKMVKTLAPEGAQIAHFNYNNNPNVEVVENGIDTMPDDQLNWEKFDKLAKKFGPKTVEGKVAAFLRDNPSQRKLVDATDFIEAEGFEAVKANNPALLSLYNSKKGTGGPKASFGDVQYLNDILKKEKMFDADKAYAVGGVRLQSFSDFVPHMYFDYMQLFAELAAKKLPAHAYTKEALFAKIFGLTGIKINMSLVPAVVDGGVAAGLDADGNYAWADAIRDKDGNIIQQAQSFDYNEAVEIQNSEGYSKNCGVIAVGISDAHIRKMLDDANIPFIIPYHKSSLNAIVARMTNIDQYKDYTKVQNTRKADGSKLDKGTKDFNFNEYLHSLGENGTPQQAAQAYLDWCKENNFIPKFNEFAGHPNYYKLLVDFNTVDARTGEYTPQGAVSMNFPTNENAFGDVEALIQHGLAEDAASEEKMDAEMEQVADEVEAKLKEIAREPKMSDKKMMEQMAKLADERMAQINERAAKSKKTYASPAEEKAAIKEQAIADGTFMKAPNGQHTKLNEDQWLTVRTQNFINWFGDWMNDPENASKVVDENGEPMVVYHGSPYGNITEFNRKGHSVSGLREFGTYFGTSKKLAELYAYARQQAKGDIEKYELEKARLDAIIFNDETPARIALDAFDELDKLNESQKPKVYEVFLNIRKPKVFDAERSNGYKGWHKLKQDVGYDIKSGVEAVEAIAGHNSAARMSEKYDGIIAKNMADVHHEENLDELIGDVFLVFDETPANIKSATSNKGTFDSSNPNILSRKGENNSNFADESEQTISNERESTTGTNNDGEWLSNGEGMDINSTRALEDARGRSDIRMFEEGLESSRSSHSDDSERTRREAESERLVGIAKENGLYIPIKETETLGDRIPKRTGESTVYINDETGEVYKVKDPYAKAAMKSIEPEDAIREHFVHNILFPETQYRLKGISEEFGEVRIVLSQKFVDAVQRPTREQVVETLREKGLYPESNYAFGNDYVSVMDVEGDNVLIGEDGTLYFIDPIIKFKKSAEEVIENLLSNELDKKRTEAQNAAINYLSGEQRIRSIENAVSEEAKKLGVNVTYKTRSEMPDGHKNDKGYYNTQTGEIVICTENASSVEDAIQTILHEAVAHKGLRQLMGDKFNEFISRVYNSLDDSTRAKVDKLAKDEYNGNTAVAMEEYMATLAEDGNFKEQSIWDKIKSFFNSIVNKLLNRNDIVINDNMLRYLLRASYNNMLNPRGMETLEGWAKDMMMRDEYGINNANVVIPEILSRTGIDPTTVSAQAARDVYDSVVNSGWNEFQRQFQDAYQPVRVAIDAIQQETGNIPIEDYENYLLIQNQMSSRSRVEIDNFQRKYYSPIIEKVNSIIDTIMTSRGLDPKNKAQRSEVYKEVRQYLIAKHGLERNAYYQNAKGEMRDFAGLTGLFGLAPTDYQNAEIQAQDVVDNFEALIGDAERDALWDKINSATDKTLRHSYESGLLSRQQYNDIKAMFNFYIPLRGFDETTAEDVYSYARFEGNRFNPAVQTAKGRTSIADDPLAIIMNMAESEIAQGNKNIAKQALYNYLLNRVGQNNQQNSLMQIEEVWYLKTVDASGNVVYIIASPNYSAGETYEQFSQRMEALAAAGDAYKSKKGNKVDVGMRFEKTMNQNAHYVYLKVNGVEKAIYINGDPKAVDAINGTYAKSLSEGVQLFRDIQRNISSTFTNYSLEFTARNYFRDMLYSHINIGVRESDPAYRKKFRQNWRHNNMGTMLKMLKAYRAGEFDNRPLTVDEAAFVEFMENGGQTGYTLIHSVEAHKRDLEKAIERMQKGIEKGGLRDSTIFKATLGGIELLNEASELVTRFAAFKTSRDMGRSVVQSISDAKEVTVNFNTRGAQDGKGWSGAIARYFGWSKYFFNASVQGVQNIKAMAEANKLKFCSTVGGIIATGFMMPVIIGVISELLGGDDDEYWNIPEYDRQNNLCIPVGGGLYAKIPLPIGYREVYAIGDMVATMAFDKKFTRDASQVGMDIANKISSVLLPINPLESSVNGLSFWHTFLYTALPSSAQFAIQNVTNVDWKGAPLQKEYTYNENDPSWMKAYESNPDWMVGLSKWCNEHINLDGDYKGMNWSPEKLDNILSNIFGGVYTVVKKSGNAISMVWNEENRNLYNVPLAGVVIGSGIGSDESFVTDAYYDMQEYYNSNLGDIKRRAEKFGYDLDDVFLKQKGSHHPKMQEIYSNSNFDFMQEWYKGNEELERLNKKVKDIEKKIAGKEKPSQALIEKLARAQAKFEAERRDFVNDMLELD